MDIETYKIANILQKYDERILLTEHSKLAKLLPT